MAQDRTLDKPLNDDDFKELKSALEKTATVEAALNKAKLAGVDIGNGLTENREARQRLQQLINTYFPGRN
jgi:hypothetical protein